MSSPVRKKLKKVVVSSSEEEDSNSSEEEEQQDEEEEEEESEDNQEESEPDGESCDSFERQGSIDSDSRHGQEDDDDLDELACLTPSALEYEQMESPGHVSVDEEDEIEAELRALEESHVPDDVSGERAPESADSVSQAKELLGIITLPMEVNAQAIVLDDLDTFKRDYKRASVMVSPSSALDVIKNMTTVQWKRTQAMYRKAIVAMNKSPPPGTLEIQRFMHCLLHVAAKQLGAENGDAWENEGGYLCHVPNIDIQEMHRLYRQRRLPRWGTPSVPEYQTYATMQSSSSSSSSSAVANTVVDGARLLDAMTVECGPAPRRPNTAFLPHGKTTVRHVCTELGLGRLSDVLSHTETAVYNLYFKTFHIQPARAPVSNVEYEEYLYDTRDTGLIMTGLSRALIYLSAKAAGVGVTKLVPDLVTSSQDDQDEGREEANTDTRGQNRAPVRNNDPVPGPPAARESGSGLPSATAPNFNLLDSDVQRVSERTTENRVRTQLPPDPPGQIRVGTVIEEMGLKSKVMESAGLEREDKYRFLDRVRMKTGAHMAASDRQNKFVRPRQEVNGRSVRVYTERDKQELERCVQLALADANVEFGTRVTLDN